MTANFQEQEHGHLMFEYMKNVKQPDMPLMVMEFWTGWFDHWGEKHHIWPLSGKKETLFYRSLYLCSYNLHVLPGSVPDYFNLGCIQNLYIMLIPVIHLQCNIWASQDKND